MFANAKRIYTLADYTVECRTKGWYYARTARFGDRQEAKGPYSSVISVTLMIARELKKEIAKRDAPYQLPE